MVDSGSGLQNTLKFVCTNSFSAWRKAKLKPFTGEVDKKSVAGSQRKRSQY